MLCVGDFLILISGQLEQRDADIAHMHEELKKARHQLLVQKEEATKGISIVFISFHRGIYG